MPSSGTQLDHGIDTQARILRDRELAGLASLSYHDRLTNFIRGSVRHLVNKSSTVVDFRPLYAVTIYDLQRRLSQEIKQVLADPLTDAQLERVRILLGEYTNALRDFEYIHANRWNTLFVKDIAASRIDNGLGSTLHAALIDELELKVKPTHLTMFSDADLLGSFDERLLQHSPTLGRTRGTRRAGSEEAQRARQAVRNAWRRFIFAIVGGLAIIVPAIVISIDRAPVRVIVIISVCILLFSCAVALFSTALPENLLAATAGYSAVLMVFIGNCN